MSLSTINFILNTSTEKLLDYLGGNMQICLAPDVDPELYNEQCSKFIGNLQEIEQKFLNRKVEQLENRGENVELYQIESNQLKMRFKYLEYCLINHNIVGLLNESNCYKNYGKPEDNPLPFEELWGSVE